jgi:hypothetical protein
MFLKDRNGGKRWYRKILAFVSSPLLAQDSSSKPFLPAPGFFPNQKARYFKFHSF